MPFPPVQQVGETTFRQADLKSLLREQMRLGLLERGEKEVASRIFVSDPVEEGAIPCIAINRADDNETEMFLSDYIEEKEDPDDPTQVIVTEGSYWAEVLDLRVWSFNPDERDQIYQQMKQILMQMRRTGAFEEHGITQIRFTGGHDEQTSDLWGRPVYWGVVHVSCLNPLHVKVRVKKIENVTVATISQALEG